MTGLSELGQYLPALAGLLAIGVCIALFVVAASEGAVGLIIVLAVIVWAAFELLNQG